ncbi:MAG TPA: polyhydroxyalkanoate synthesis regulator DNA-binding domain-containing protein [Polyangiaceae bacterium]|nr:polyhydroxyalkanoate synthesis regulator DNA-binding domain-containing protein [Polyangiaceae bacterium]
MSSDTQDVGPPPDTRRIIKRYTNRKLYDTKDSRYVTLAQIAELVRSGEEVQIIDNATKEDKTEATLALIISEEVKTRPKAVPLGALRELVHARGERFLSNLRESPIGRLFPGIGEGELGAEGGEAAAAAAAGGGGDGAQAADAAAKAGEGAGRNRLQELVDSSRQTIEEWQAAIDDRIKAVLPVFYKDHQAEVRRLTQRVEELETQLAALTKQRGKEASSGAEGRE